MAQIVGEIIKFHLCSLSELSTTPALHALKREIAFCDRKKEEGFETYYLN